MFLKRFFPLILVIFVVGCQSNSPPPRKFTIGVISLGESEQSVEQYAELDTYLESKLRSLIEFEPTYNEIKAVDQIERKTWDIVFAPPGLAAIAISQSQYLPLFPLEGGLNTRSAIVVLNNSPIAKISQLAGKVVGLGQAGSVTGYYLPIYNLYGLTLAEVRLASTPKDALGWVASGEVDAGAMSLAEFNRYRSEFPNARFRILYTDSHPVPSGSVLVSPTLEPAQKANIREALAGVSSSIAASAGYITNAPVPDYQYLIKVVNRVLPIAERIHQKPAPLYEKKKNSQL